MATEDEVRKELIRQLYSNRSRITELESTLQKMIEEIPELRSTQEEIREAKTKHRGIMILLKEFYK